MKKILFMILVSLINVFIIILIRNLPSYFSFPFMNLIGWFECMLWDKFFKK